jgi:hypothetical protein
MGLGVVQYTGDLGRTKSWMKRESSPSTWLLIWVTVLCLLWNWNLHCFSELHYWLSWFSKLYMADYQTSQPTNHLSQFLTSSMYLSIYLYIYLLSIYHLFIYIYLCIIYLKGEVMLLVLRPCPAMPWASGAAYLTKFVSRVCKTIFAAVEEAWWFFSQLQQECTESRGDKTARSRSSERTLQGPVNFGGRGIKEELKEH